MVLWIVVGFVVVAFAILAFAAKTGSGNGGSVFQSAKRESLITYELRKNVMNNVSASDLSVPQIDEYFADADPEYEMVKHLLHGLISAGYKVGDYIWSAELTHGRGVMLYIYDKNAPRTNRLLESMGTIFMCKSDEDFEVYSMPSAKRNDLAMPGLCIANKSTRVSVHSNDLERMELPEWLSACIDIFVKDKHEFTNPEWAEPPMWKDIVLNEYINERR